MITIDGTQGEGGGQVLRSSLALSLVTGKPFRITRIRGRRPKPGLRRQHLTAVNSAALISRAEVRGNAMGATELTFSPGPVLPGKYHFAIGTAGSATLVLQTILPALLLADHPSSLTLEGGTHNPLAPCFDFLDRSFLPLLNRMGARVDARLQRYGFYPAGGGSFTVRIEAGNRLAPLVIEERGELLSLRAEALVARLPLSIAERELMVLQKQLGFSPEQCRARQVASTGPGNVVLVEITSRNTTELMVGFGEKGVPAERVANRLADQVAAYLDSGAAVGRHLADQLLLPIALAGSGSFTTMEPSRHTLTNIQVLQQFLDLKVQIDQLTDQHWRLTLKT